MSEIPSPDTSGAATQSPYSAAIAYLAPEIPALSATFVYEEMLGLERRGITVVPFSVHRPQHTAQGQEVLAGRVRHLYTRSKPLLALMGLARLPFLRGTPRALGWLLGDMRECGLLRPDSWKLAFQFLAGARLADQLVEQRCTHLHIHFAHVPTQIGMYAAAMAGIPFTVMAHANDIFERGLLLPRKAARAAKLLTISEFNRAYLEGLGVAADKLAVMRCGVSFSIREPAPSCQRRLSYRIGTLGRLVEKKGVDDLIRAVGQLRDRSYRIELSIAGDGPLRHELEGLVGRLGLGESVRFEGNMPHARVREWMHGLDAFVLACKPDANGDMDGIPVVLMEAMSQRIPVVSTRLSGIPELVVDGETGLLAAADNPADLAAQIDRLLDAPELQHRLTERAEAHVRAEFGSKVNLDRLAQHLGGGHDKLIGRQVERK
ncbi:MAG: glycosyltransferase [Pseudomonadota bacterium]